MLTVYSPGTIPRTVTISSRIGEAIFFPLTRMKSFAPPRSSRSSTIKPASRRRYQAMLPDSILHEQIKIIGMVVGPIHGDDKLGLRIDLTLVGLGSDRQQRDKEEEGDD